MPAMPTLPLVKAATKFSPASTSALSGIRPSSHICRYWSSTSNTASPSSAASSPLRGRILAPPATISGEVTKMLQPGQEPAK